MRVFIVAQGTTSLEGLKVSERERPSPGAGQVLVRMRAASMNFRDLAIVAGKYFRGPVTHDTIPLSDGAGEVTAVGAGVTQFAVGDRVVATFTQGHPATGTRLPARRRADRVRRIPGGRSAAPAAAPVVRGSRDAAVCRRDRVERADARPEELAPRRDGADARHRRRLDLRAADRQDDRRARDHHVVERCEARACACARRRSLHQLQEHAELGREGARAHGRAGCGPRDRHRRRRHAAEVVSGGGPRRHGRASSAS